MNSVGVFMRMCIFQINFSVHGLPVSHFIVCHAVWDSTGLDFVSTPQGLGLDSVLTHSGLGLDLILTTRPICMFVQYKLRPQ